MYFINLKTSKIQKSIEIIGHDNMIYVYLSLDNL